MSGLAEGVATLTPGEVFLFVTKTGVCTGSENMEEAAIINMVIMIAPITAPSITFLQRILIGVI